MMCTLVADLLALSGTSTHVDLGSDAVRRNSKLDIFKLLLASCLNEISHHLDLTKKESTQQQG